MVVDDELCSGRVRRRCPHLQAQVAKLMEQIPEKYLKKEPVLAGAGRSTSFK